MGLLLVLLLLLRPLKLSADPRGLALTRIATLLSRPRLAII